MLRHLALSAFVLVALGLGACDDPLTRPAEKTSTAPDLEAASNQTTAAQHRELAEVRRALAAYNDLRAARADGYTQFSIHVPGMGIHHLTSSAIGADGNSTLDGSLDRTDPEILVYVDDAADAAKRNPQRRLVAAEYAVPKNGPSPPSEAVNLFTGADADDWHVHPSRHEFGLPASWTLHGECHYEGGLGIFLAENSSGLLLWTPVAGNVGSWDGPPITAADCPATGPAGTPLLIGHGKWWTLHVWAWYPNPEGVFHPTNPRVP